MTDVTTEDVHARDYEPPHLRTLGTLAELTQGDAVADEDLFGGFENSTPPS